MLRRADLSRIPTQPATDEIGLIADILDFPSEPLIANAIKIGFALFEQRFAPGNIRKTAFRPFRRLHGLKLLVFSVVTQAKRNSLADAMLRSVGIGRSKSFASVGFSRRIAKRRPA